MVTAQARRLRDFGRVAHKGWYSVIDVSRTHVFFPSRVFSATAEPWSGRAQLLDGRLHAARWKLEIAESIARQTRTRFATTPVLRQWSSVIGPTRYCTSVEKEKRVSKQVCVSFTSTCPATSNSRQCWMSFKDLTQINRYTVSYFSFPSRRN